ncbi:unnamed protein product [Cuscuta epithymum]|uniref:Sororin C-terminal region domain-containing protein n=1 Tax=Cuscuta epithymum TaxID=186058 RepID=A0AAV0FBV2_9ASTE|nr:unnamed protein product [Cuscuta epithymum]
MDARNPRRLKRGQMSRATAALRPPFSDISNFTTTTDYGPSSAGSYFFNDSPDSKSHTSSVASTSVLNRSNTKLSFSAPSRSSRSTSVMSEESALSTTGPSKRYPKKRCSGKLSLTEESSLEDFVKKQKAYFKEVDEFELQEEEASD